MKYFITSDIHGCFKALQEGLNEVGFNKEEDTFVSLGDNFDRGKENWEVYEFLQSLPRCILIRGNHEDLFVNMIKSQQISSTDTTNGTKKTLSDIGKHLFKGEHQYNTAYYLKHMQNTEFFRWLDSDIWKDYIVLGKYLLTHATCPNVDSSWSEARWLNPYTNRLKDNPLYKDKAEVLVSGHWFAFLGGYYAEGGSTEGFPCIEIPSHSTEKQRIGLSRPHVEEDLIMIDAYTLVTHKCNILVYDDATKKMYFNKMEIINTSKK